MGMGYSASFADVIDEKYIQEICPIKWQALNEALDKEDITLTEYAAGIQYGDDVGSEAVHKAYEDLVNMFNSKTNDAGLSLEYHDQEQGDRYDDVDGHFWTCANLYILSEAGKQLKGKFRRKFYVQFG